MKDEAFGLLMRAIESDGIIRIPMEKAADHAVLYLIKEGFIRAMAASSAPVTEIWYQVDMASKPRSAEQRFWTEAQQSQRQGNDDKDAH